MVKFQYPLQNILHIKEKIEDQRKMALKDAHHYLDVQKEKLNQLHGRLDANNGHFRRTVADTIKVREILTLNKMNQYVHTCIKEQNTVVTQATCEVETKRIELTQALMEKKMYEKLKEKAYESYMHEANKEEQKQLDEIVSYKYRKLGK